MSDKMLIKYISCTKYRSLQHHLATAFEFTSMIIITCYQRNKYASPRNSTIGVFEHNFYTSYCKCFYDGCFSHGIFKSSRISILKSVSRRGGVGVE